MNSNKIELINQIHEHTRTLILSQFPLAFQNRDLKLDRYEYMHNIVSKLQSEARPITDHRLVVPP